MRWLFLGLLCKTSIILLRIIRKVLKCEMVFTAHEESLSEGSLSLSNFWSAACGWAPVENREITWLNMHYAFLEHWGQTSYTRTNERLIGKHSLWELKLIRGKIESEIVNHVLDIGLQVHGAWWKWAWRKTFGNHWVKCVGKAYCTRKYELPYTRKHP